MAVTPDTQIRLIKCNLNLDENNQIDFANGTAQGNYFESLPHVTKYNCSYQRKDNYIRWPDHIDNIIKYNYVAYKNTHYGGKWFFAYITRMEYENDNCTRIYIKTDVWQTWQFDLTFMRSFVEREHVNNDTIGLHTVPENLETGEYCINATQRFMTDTQFYPIIATGTVKNIDGGLMAPANSTYNNVFCGEWYYGFTSNTDATNFIKEFSKDGQIESINSVFMVPKSIWDNLSKSAKQTHTASDTSHFTFDYYCITGDVSGVIIASNQSVSMQTTLNGYTPKNNKLKCFPYNFLEVTNNCGTSNIYHYEKFVNNAPAFNILGAITPGCSIKVIPISYNNIEDSSPNSTGPKNSWQDGITGGKYPIGSWNCDVYTNWLTQNGVNLTFKALSGALTLGTGIASGNPVAIGSGVTAIGSVIGEKIQHELTPDVTKGNANSGDVTYSHMNLFIQFNKKSIKQEYAKIIDDFFSMYGYKVNSLKVPNITGRTNWNYVKLINPNIEGYIPQEDLQEIKRMFSNGITIWHNTSTFLDYSQTNSIVT